MDFFDLPREVYDAMIYNASDTTIASLRQVSRETLHGVTSVTSNGYYWARKLSSALGISVEAVYIPDGVDARQLLLDVQMGDLWYSAWLARYITGDSLAVDGLLYQACRQGLIRTVNALPENVVTEDAVRAAALIGSVDILKVLLKRNSNYACSIDINQVARNGHLSIVSMLVEERKIDPISIDVADVALRGHTYIVEYLLRNGRCNTSGFDANTLGQILHNHRDTFASILQIAYRR